MSTRTVRTVRTALQVVIAVCAAIPAVVSGLPSAAIGAQVVAVAVAVTHWFSFIESLPFFPDSLRVNSPAPEPSPEGQVF